MRTILIIEDDEVILSMYALALENAGYRVITAQDGAAGLELAKRNLPDLIICDLNMPRQDGWSTLRGLRDDPEVAATQFVLMTGNSKDVTSRDGMELGADDFLLKPISKERLLRCVDARLQRAGIHHRRTEKAIAEMKSNLHSNLPHEFFTPLAGILGLVDVLRCEGENLPSEENLELLDEIRRSGWRLHRTLRNYLLAIDSGLPSESTKPPLSPSPPDQLMQALRSCIREVAERHQRSCDLVADLELCPAICSKEDLTILVEEVVDNAFAYSREGQKVRVRFRSSGVLTVSDEGRGMTAAQIAQIGAFRQFDRKRFEQQGLGVGLFLVRTLCARNGAQIDIDSSVGAGTTVSLTFAIQGDEPKRHPSQRALMGQQRH